MMFVAGCMTRLICITGTNFMRMFSPVVRNHTGNYTCIAYNSLNSNSPTRNTIRVDVVCKYSYCVCV